MIKDVINANFFGIEFCALFGIIVGPSQKSAMDELASLDLQSTRARKIEQRFHRDFDGLDFTNR
jgi:hypothetical protein